jgi:hypothetical protein
MLSANTPKFKSTTMKGRKRTLIIQPGDRLGMLTLVDAPEERSDNGHRIGTFQCDCGKLKKIKIYYAARGMVKSCGCQRERSFVSKDEIENIQKLIKTMPLRRAAQVCNRNISVVVNIAKYGTSTRPKKVANEGCFNWADYKDGVL